jgi:hypothetical protein
MTSDGGSESSEMHLKKNAMLSGEPACGTGRGDHQAGLGAGIKHHARRPKNAGATIATIIRLRRLYFMVHGLGGFGTGGKELGNGDGQPMLWPCSAIRLAYW